MVPSAQLTGLLLASALLAGCSSGPDDHERLPMAHGILGAYEAHRDTLEEVWIDGRLVGFSEALSIVDLDGRIHSRREVLDPYGQAIGYVDASGRVYRYRLFEDPEHVTTAGHAGAVRALFDRRHGEVAFRLATATLSAR